MKRRLAWVALGALAVLGLGLVWLFYSETALAWLWARVSGPRLEAATVAGRLAGPLRIERLTLRAGGTTVTVAEAAIDWRPLALLVGNLSFERVAASGVVVTTEAADGEPGPPFSGVALPLDLVVSDGRLADLTWRRNGEAPFAVDSGRLVARWDGGRVRIDAFEAAGPWGGLSLHGDAGTMPDAPLGLAGAWRVTLPDLPPVAGEGRITGTLAEPRWQQRLLEPVAVTVDGRLAWLDQPPTWSMAIHADGLEPAAIPGIPPFTVAGRIEAHGSGTTAEALTTLTLSAPDKGRWQLDGRVRHAAGNLEVASLRLAEVDGPSRLEGRGQWEAGRFAADVTWADLRWPLKGEATAVSPRGEAHAEGTTADYRLTADADVAAAGLPTADLRLAGSGDTAGFNLSRLEAAWLGGTLAGTGRIGWRPVLAWQAELTGSGLDPARVDPQWPGRVGFSVSSRGELSDRLTATLSVKRADGNLRGLPVAAAADLAIDGDRIELRPLTLRSGDVRVHAAGSVAERWELAWSVDAPQLAQLHPALAGGLSGRGKVTGPRTVPAVAATLEGRRLAYAGQQLARLTLDASVDLDPARRSRFDLTLAGLAAGPLTLTEARLQGGGTSAEHTLTLELRTPDAHFRQDARGGLLAPTAAATGQRVPFVWELTLDGGRLDGEPPTLWRQQAPARLVVTDGRVALDPWCWAAGSARLCVGLTDAGAAWQASVTAVAVPVAALAAPWLPEGLETAGRLHGELTATGQGARAGRLDGSIRVDGAHLRYAGGDIPVETRFQRVRLTLAGAAGEGLRGDLAMTGDDGDLEAEAALAEWAGGLPPMETPVRGRLTARVDRFDWLAALAAPLAEPRGRFDAELRLDGRLGAPRIAGSLALREGGAHVIPAGISVSAVELSGASGDGRFTLTGQLRSGAGSVRLTGAIETGTEGGWRATVRAEGSDFEAVRLPAAQVSVSPDLTLDLRPFHARLTGSVRVDRADIQLPEIPRTVTVSEDVVIVDGNGDGAPAPRRWRTEAEVRLILGEKVRLAGYGFTGRLTGQLDIVDAPGERGTVARGELHIRDGLYAAYGQELVIDRGRLLFANTPLTNPGIDLRAVRTVEEVTVGIVVSGRLRDPVLQLFSEPPLDDTNTLSYLVLGRPVGNLSKSEGSLLYRAALSLGFKGGSLLVQELGARFGLDEVELESGSEVQEAALVLGKRLSPRLYLQYAVNFGETVNTLRVRYDLGGRWTLEAETGAQVSTDLLFTIER